VCSNSTAPAAPPSKLVLNNAQTSVRGCRRPGAGLQNLRPLGWKQRNGAGDIGVLGSRPLSISVGKIRNEPPPASAF